MNQRRSTGPLLALSFTFSVAMARAQSPDPFAPNVRWAHAAVASSAWMPAAVDFGAEGELTWSAGYGASSRTMLFASGAQPPATDLAPEREDVAFAGSSGAIQVRAARGARALFSIAQYPVQDVAHRRTEIARYEPTASTFAPQWRSSLNLIGNGSCRLAVARDGSRVVAAAHDNASSLLDVEWLDGNTGAPAMTLSFASSTLRELDASDDVQRVALVAGTRVSLLDASGATPFQQDLGVATNALALSGDGHTLAFGYGPRVRVSDDHGGAFHTTQDLWGSFGELPIRLALSNDGSTLAIAWWNQTSGTSMRFQVWRAGVLAFERFESTPGTYQNYPTVATLTPNGDRALFAAWGHPSTAPELWLVDVPSSALVWSLDLPGSALTAALDDSGARFAVGVKHAHANQFASTGEFRLYDTGERDLQIVGTASVANGLHLATHMSGATRAFFLLGHRLTTPVPFPNSTGALAIDRGQIFRAFVRPCDAAGRADLTIRLPSPALGVDFSAQAVFRVGLNLRFTSTVVAPVVF